MTKSNSAGKAPAQPTPRAIELEPLWKSETYDSQRRGLLSTYLKLVSASAVLFPNELIRQEVIRLNRAVQVQAEAEEKDFDEAFEIRENVDDLVSRASNIGLGNLPAEIANALTETPGLTRHHHAS